MRYDFFCISLVLTVIQMVDAKPRFNPVSDFDLNRYLGKWYEIARFQHRFEKDLVNVTATYTLRDDGKVDVLNQGYNNSKDGKLKTARGKAKFAGSKNIGHLKVTFFWPFYGDYIIVELDKENYNFALVVSDSYDYLWILSRTPNLESAILISLLDKARELGFDTNKVYLVPQE